MSLMRRGRKDENQTTKTTKNSKLIFSLFVLCLALRGLFSEESFMTLRCRPETTNSLKSEV